MAWGQSNMGRALDANTSHDGNYPSYDTTTTTGYIPILFAKKMLRKFYAQSAYELISNTDYEGEIKKQGDQVVISRAPDMTIDDYEVGLDIDYEVPVSTAVTLNIDTAKYWAFRIDDIDKVATHLPLMNEFTSNAAQQLQVTIDTDCLAVWAAGADSDNVGATAGAISGDINLGVTNTPVTIGLGETDPTNHLVACNQVLDEQNIEQQGRFVVAPSAYIARLKISDLKSADITGDSTGVIRSGVVGMVDRFLVIQNNNLPSGGGTATDEFQMIFGTKEALTFAMQLTESETLRIPTSFGDYARGLAVYGKQVVQPKALGMSVVNFSTHIVT